MWACTRPSDLSIQPPKATRFQICHFHEGCLILVVHGSAGLLRTHVSIRLLINLHRPNQCEVNLISSTHKKPSWASEKIWCDPNEPCFRSLQEARQPASPHSAKGPRRLSPNIFRNSRIQGLTPALLPQKEWRSLAFSETISWTRKQGFHLLGLCNHIL